MEAGLGRKMAAWKRMELEDVEQCRQVDEGCEECVTKLGNC